MIKTETPAIGATATASSTRALAFALAAVCWGALAFGASYPWAYWPLAAVCGTAGIMGLLDCRGVVGVSRSLALALGAVAVAMLLQMVPLPLSWLQSVSPRALPLLADTDFRYGAGLTRFHPVSIDPASTGSALALFVSFAVLLLGMTRVLAGDQTRRLVETLTIFGVILALIGIVQKPIYSGRLLGFWEPQTPGTPFGPFINRNHFAGWMLMALPLTLTLLIGGLEQSMRGVKAGWRYRILWLSSAEANRLILLAAAAVVMALSLVMTLSRSGITAMAVSLMLTGWIVARGLQSRSRRRAVATYLLVLAVTTFAWVGADVIFARFSESNWTEFNHRRGAWADALDVSAAFRLTGTGLNTYETAARFYQRHDLDQFYGESHNDYLELMAEGGLLVGIPALTCLLLLVREIRRRMKDDPPSTVWWLRRGAVTGLIAIAFQETVDFSLQMPGNAVMFVVLCAIALHRPRAARHAEPQPEPAPTRPRMRVVASNAMRVEVGR